MNNKGFSLIEVLISLVILAIGLLAIAGMQVTSIRGNSFSNNLTQATILAQDRLEQMKNLPYASLSSGQDTVTVSGFTFTRQYNVDSAVLGGSSTMTMITVTVSWTDTSTHSVSLNTIRAEL